MKKVLFLFIGVLAMLATSCGYKSIENPLKGDLVTYTAEGTKDGEVLLGVKDKAGKEDKVIVPAAAYSQITADDYYITCTRSDDAAYDVFTLSGAPVGPQTFNAFSRLTIDNTMLYCGTAGEKIYYFFEGKPAVECNLSYVTAKNLFVHNAAAWDVYTADGNIAWTFPSDAVIIKSTKSEEHVIVVAVTKKKVTTYKFYTVDGKELKVLNAYRWKQFQKQLKDPQKLGETELYELETVKIEKLTI